MILLLKIFLIHLILVTPLSKVFSQWEVSGNFGDGFVYSLHIKSNYIFAGTSTQGVFRSDNEGVNWTQINSGLGNSISVQCITSNDNFIFTGTSSGGVFNSIDNGSNWIQSNQGIFQLNIKSLITDDSSVFAGCIFAGIFRSVNNGSNWYRWGLGEGDLLSSLVYNENAFLVGLNGGMYRTTNNGVNWMIAHNGITNLDIRTLVNGRDRLWCGTFGGGVFVSDNSGVSWTLLSTGLTDMNIQTLASDGNNIFSGTLRKGIHYFNPTSNSWQQINQGLTDTNIISIAVNEDFIFAGSTRGKVWRRHLNEIVTGLSNNNTPLSDFHLYQNYPNPFNPVTNISFYIPERSYVTLKIFDNLGKEVSQIYSGALTEGSHTKLFNAENFPAGVYYYELSSEMFSDVKKLVLIK